MMMMMKSENSVSLDNLMETMKLADTHSRNFQNYAEDSNILDMFQVFQVFYFKFQVFSGHIALLLIFQAFPG